MSTHHNLLGIKNSKCNIKSETPQARAPQIYTPQIYGANQTPRQGRRPVKDQTRSLLLPRGHAAFSAPTSTITITITSKCARLKWPRVES